MIQLAPRQVWMFVDTETTGLAATAPGAAILELGMLAVEVPTFREVASWSSVVRPLDPDGNLRADVLQCADDYVRNMHTQSGLKAELEAASPGLTRGFVQEQAIRFYNLHCSGRRSYLGGANPSFDQQWLAVHMPQLAAKFHYRPFDTNALFQLREALVGVEKSGQRHRVLDDCRQAVAVVHEHFDLMRQMFGGAK